MLLDEKAIARFWAKVSKSFHQKGCWEWTGFRDSHGYGCQVIGNRVFKAHRVSVVVSGLEIPPKMEVMHACDNPRCVNPSHLKIGTHAENMRDMGDKGRSLATAKPWRLARGDRSGPRKHPERMPKGENHYASKLTAENVLQIRSDKIAGKSYSSLARQFSVSKKAVLNICKGRTWKSVQA